MAHRKGSYKIQEVVEVVDAPCEFSGRVYEYERLACGHYRIKPEQRETAKMIREMMNAFSGAQQKRHCTECVSGHPCVPEISKAWVSIWRASA